MGDILTGIVKGLSGFMLQDDPDVKIFNAQTEMKEFSEGREKSMPVSDGKYMRRMAARTIRR